MCEGDGEEEEGEFFFVFVVVLHKKRTSLNSCPTATARGNRGRVPTCDSSSLLDQDSCNELFAGTVVKSAN